MSVLIKDMEKPKSCYAVIDGEVEYCPFVNTDDDCVLLLKKGICELSWEEQYSKCPLVEEPERKTGKWTTEEVAEILFNAFGDDCACNFNGIDEWLPERCKYTQIAGECPEPKEKHGCWMQFLLQGGADMRGEKE